MLLDQGHLLGQDIQPQVAPAQHDGVCLLSNGLEVEQALAGLALGYQLQQYTACGSCLRRDDASKQHTQAITAPTPAAIAVKLNRL